MISAIYQGIMMACYDLLRKMRTYGFLIMLGLVITIGYLFVPPSDAGYQTMYIGGVRGLYNSAWIGAMAALCSSLLLWPFGFYFLRGTISEDCQLGIGPFLLCSPLRRLRYLLSRAIGNFMTLAVMAAVLELAFVVMQYIRMEETQFVLTGYLLPYLWIVLPSLFVLTALTILFDTIPFMKGVIGNILFFCIWTGLSVASFSGVGQLDVFGSNLLFTEIVIGVKHAFPHVDVTNMNFGYQTAQALLTFTWQGIKWTEKLIPARLFWLLIAACLFLISLLSFRMRALLPKESKMRNQQTNLESVKGHYKEIDDVPLHPIARTSRYSFYQIVRYELKLILRSAPLWWYGIGAILFHLILFIPLDSSKALRILLWLWPIQLLASIGAREKMYRTEQLVFSNAPPFLQLSAVWLSGVLVTLVVASSGIIQMVITGEWQGLAAWFTAILFTPTLALALGIWSGTRKLYDAIYVVWWFLGPLQNAPHLDFTGIQNNNLTIYLMLTFALVIMAFVGRKRQLNIN